MATVRKAEIAECNEKAEARLKARLGEQRGELEADFADSVLRIEHKQKQEIETMMAKLNSSNDDLVSKWGNSGAKMNPSRTY